MLARVHPSSVLHLHPCQNLIGRSHHRPLVTIATEMKQQYDCRPLQLFVCKVFDSRKPPTYTHARPHTGNDSLPQNIFVIRILPQPTEERSGDSVVNESLGLWKG